MLRSLRHRFPRLGRRTRALVAAACLGLAAVGALGARPHPSARSGTEPVVVAARTLPAGRILGAGDLALRRWPATLAPAGSPATVSAVVGRRLAGAVVAGDVITAPRLLGRDLTTGLPTGSVAAAVSLPDPHVGDLVRPGDRVDVLSTPTAPTDTTATATATATQQAAPIVVAAGVRVLAVLADPDASADGPGTELIVAATRDVATRLLRTAPGAVLTVMGDSP